MSQRGVLKLHPQEKFLVDLPFKVRAEAPRAASLGTFCGFVSKDRPLSMDTLPRKGTTECQPPHLPCVNCHSFWEFPLLEVHPDFSLRVGQTAWLS